VNGVRTTVLAAAGFQNFARQDNTHSMQKTMLENIVILYVFVFSKILFSPRESCHQASTLGFWLRDTKRRIPGSRIEEFEQNSTTARFSENSATFRLRQSCNRRRQLRKCNRPGAELLLLLSLLCHPVLGALLSSLPHPMLGMLHCLLPHPVLVALCSRGEEERRWQGAENWEKVLC
jgi:hypothetical protein